MSALQRSVGSVDGVGQGHEDNGAVPALGICPIASQAQRSRCERERGVIGKGEAACGREVDAARVRQQRCNPLEHLIDLFGR